MVTESAKLTIGLKKKVHQDSFVENDERIKELLDDKKKAFTEWQNDISTSKNQNVTASSTSKGSPRGLIHETNLLKFPTGQLPAKV